MSLVVHQLRKELRWLWPRWCVFVVAMVCDFVVQMQWVFPFAEEPGFGLPSLIWSLPMWIIAWWLLMSVPPEEHGMAFRVTLPLSRVQYWLARVLAGVVLVMLPAMIENAAVLLAQGRPWTDAARGVAETGIAVAVMMLWLLPAGTMFRGWEKYAVLVLFLYGAMNGMPQLWLQKLGVEYREAWWVLFNASLMHRSAAITGVLMLALAFWHTRRPMGRLVRLAVPVVMGMSWTIPAMFPSFPSATEAPADEELVKQFTQGREIEIRGVERAMSLESDGLPLRAEVRMEGIPTGIAPYWRVEQCRIMRDGLEVKEAPRTRFDTRGDASNVGALPFQMPFTSLLPSSFPSDALVLMQGSLENVRLAMLPTDLKPGKPLDLDLRLAADWLRVRELGRMPLKAGATIRAPENEIEVLEVIVDADNRGHERKGALTLRLRERHVTFAGRNAVRPFMPVLCLWAADKRLVWQQVMTGLDQQRGENHGWMTLQREVTFLWPVVSSGTGVTKENLAGQELVWIGGEYLGTSRHEVRLENVVISGSLQRNEEWPQAKPSIKPGNPREEFLELMHSLARPPERASREEIARYVAAVYQASNVYRERVEHTYDQEPKWAGNDREVHLRMVPYLVKYSDLFRTALEHDYADLTKGIVHEALLQAGIPGITRSEKTGEPSYARQTPVLGRPNEMRSRRMETLWLTSYNNSFDAYLAAIQQHSDEPLWPLMDEKPLITEEVFADYTNCYDRGWLRHLMKQSELSYREKTERLTRKAFSELPAVTFLDREQERPLYAAVALGMPEALDWLLRIVALKDDENPGALMLKHNAVFSSLDEGRPSSKTLLQFLYDARRFSAKDFRYDAEKMRWELKTEVKP